MPACAFVRPSYICRSEPQIAGEVTLTRTSVGACTFGSGTVSTATLNGSLCTSAFIGVLLNPEASNRRSSDAPHGVVWCRSSGTRRVRPSFLLAFLTSQSALNGHAHHH